MCNKASRKVARHIFIRNRNRNCMKLINCIENHPPEKRTDSRFDETWTFSIKKEEKKKEREKKSKQFAFYHFTAVAIESIYGVRMQIVLSSGFYLYGRLNVRFGVDAFSTR